MKSRWYLLMLIPLLVLILSACSTKGPASVGDSGSDGVIKSEDNPNTEANTESGEGALKEEEQINPTVDHKNYPKHRLPYTDFLSRYYYLK